MTNENNEDLPKPILIKDLGMMFHTESSSERKRFGIYECGFCGTEFRASTQDILRGITKSCGCYKKRRISEANKTHGLAHTRLNNIWRGMKKRIFGEYTKRYNNRALLKSIFVFL